MTWKEKPWAGECTQNVPVTYNPLPQAQCWNKWPYSIYPEKWHFKCMTQRGEDCSVAEIKHLQGQHSSILLQRSRAAINFRGSSVFFEPGATCNWCQRSHRTVLVEICGVLEYFPHLVWLNFPKSFYNQSSVCVTDCQRFFFFFCVNANNSNKRLNQPNAKPLGCWLTWLFHSCKEPVVGVESYWRSSVKPPGHQHTWAISAANLNPSSFVF